jgi:hypothetical protein
MKHPPVKKRVPSCGALGIKAEVDGAADGGIGPPVEKDSAYEGENVGPRIAQERLESAIHGVFGCVV